MKDWLRRVDPAFYRKEPQLLRTESHIARYTDAVQAHVRLGVLKKDNVLHAATLVVTLAAYVIAVAAGAVDVRSDLPAALALAVLAVAASRALPWRSDAGPKARWLDALLGVVLIVGAAAWTRIDLFVGGVALLAGVALYVAWGRSRFTLIVLAVGLLFGLRMPVHPIVVALLVGVISAVVFVLLLRAFAIAWPIRPQIATWCAFAILLAVCAYTFAFNSSAAALRVPAEIVAIAVAYVAICIIAGRIRRAELVARPQGVLSLPQSIVPLLDRSHHHAVICWLA